MFGRQEPVHERAHQLAASLIPHAEVQAGSHDLPVGIQPRWVGGHKCQDKLYILENEGLLHRVTIFPCRLQERSILCNCP